MLFPLTVCHFRDIVPLEPDTRTLSPLTSNKQLEQVVEVLPRKQALLAGAVADAVQCGHWHAKP